jgi:hypothetical protein
MQKKKRKKKKERRRKKKKKENKKRKMQSQAFHRARAAMYLQRAARHEARAAAFGAPRDTPCRMQLVAGRLGVDSETPIRLPDELAAESAASLYVVELRGGATGTPNDEQARLLAALLGRMRSARVFVDNVDVTGIYVATLTDWNGLPWRASLACADNEGHRMHYTTNRGTLVFRRRASRHEARATAFGAQRATEALFPARNRATGSFARYGVSTEHKGAAERRELARLELAQRHEERTKTGRTEKEMYEHLERAYPYELAKLTASDKDKLVQDTLRSGKSSFDALEHMVLQYHH